MNDSYAKAYTEVLEIISHLSEEEYSKIPIEKIEFFRMNMDKSYKYTINPEIDLSEQEISNEANGILVNLFINYFATDKQKDTVNALLEQNQIKLENEKREKYNPDKIFEKQKENKIDNEIETNNNLNEKSIIEYKETFFTKLKKFILNLLHKNN